MVYQLAICVYCVLFYWQLLFHYGTVFRQLQLFIQLHGLPPPLVYLFIINVSDGEIRLSQCSVVNLFLWNKNKESD